MIKKRAAQAGAGSMLASLRRDSRRQGKVLKLVELRERISTAVELSRHAAAHVPRGRKTVLA